MKLSDNVLQAIWGEVLLGYHDKATIRFSIAQWFGTELGIDENATSLHDVPRETMAAIDAGIDDAVAQKAEDMCAWPAVTDCDRLRAAFQTLEAAHIITAENCGMHLDDGIWRVSNIDLARVDDGAAPAQGFCFFHEQDTVGALEGRGLMLAYGTFGETDAQKTAAQKTQAIGQIVATACRAQGLDVVWDGSADSRIVLKGFVWQNRLSP
ncbi:Hypothetical protein A7982_11552 [Minicystis rosea]|nr:Hypothetical protein A7982_11552 [Minicystis rosea]